MEGNEAVDFAGASRRSTYEFIARTLGRFGYRTLARSDKGLVRRYLAKVTGRSRAQWTRLVRQYLDTGCIADRRGGPPACPFPRRYTKGDIRLLARVDEQWGQMSGPATRAVMRREFEGFADARFERLSGRSNGPLYNLRKSLTYRTKRTRTDRTRPSGVALGERRGPCPEGRPGFMRVDSVHQGDHGTNKGRYLVNLVDEVTQYQFVGALEAISERFMVPMLEALIEEFPFVVHGFHADNGSEYVNHRVAKLLHKLHVGQFTKSRPRRSNDNAPVESKNASVVRKYLGHDHIPRRFAPKVHSFTRDFLSPFLNYHRPCLFPHERTGPNGKLRKVYRDQDVCTPYDKLKSLNRATLRLRPGVTFEQLDAVAYAVSDLTAAQQLNQAREALFADIARSWTAAA